jgi:ribonucleotide monophosphatase NagD (HAD superfamily)
MIGDRLYTDVRMARDAGVLAILTLTGEANAAEAEQLPPQLQPNLIVKNLNDLAQQLTDSQRL